MTLRGFVRAAASGQLKVEGPGRSAEVLATTMVELGIDQPEALLAEAYRILTLD